MELIPLNGYQKVCYASKLQVSFMTKITTPDEELLVRSLHQSLRDCEHVSAVELGQVNTPLCLIRAE